MKVLKNNRGFSLVELIIVITIMVALIAVLGPQYIKYVQQSRNAVVQDAAEAVFAYTRTEYAAGNLDGEGNITIDPTSGKLVLKINGDLTYCGKTGDEATKLFIKDCCVDEEKPVISTYKYIIKVKKDKGTTKITKEDDSDIEMITEEIK